ncbi:MAG TPA: DUF4384 domain-containing protein [Burkholderiaceae bacterium]|nr:DUF4384 domain-containing protein [Burkholderiaceae bacterium]
MAALVVAVAAATIGLRQRAPVPGAGSVVATVPDGTAASAAPAQSAPTPAVSPAATPARPAYEPVAVLREVLERADPGIGVEARADQGRIVIDRDRLQFRLRSSSGGFVYVLFVGTDARELLMLFPNAIDADNRLRPDQELVLPRPKWRITAGGPPGADHVLVLVSAQPRRFDAAGARLRDGESMPVFEPEAARRAWADGHGGSNPFAGEPDCAATADCDRRYGAALLRIEEVGAGAK